VFADFQFAVSGGPCVLVQCVAVNIRFLFAIFKWGAGNIFVRSQTRATSNIRGTRSLFDVEVL
jgi:hypothetical protein